MSIWVVVFVVPINAAIDPILYTFTTPKFRRLLAQLFAGTNPGNSNNSGRRFNTSSVKFKDTSCMQPMISPQHRRMSWDHVSHHPRRVSRETPTAADPTVSLDGLNDPAVLIEMANLESPTACRRNSL